MHLDPVDVADLLLGGAERLLHVVRAHAGIRALQLHRDLRGIRARKEGRHTDIDVAQFALALPLRVLDTLADPIVHIARIVPPGVHKPVIGGDPGTHNIAAQIAGIVRNQGDDLARAEIHSRNRGLHLPQPPVGTDGRPARGHSIQFTIVYYRRFRAGLQVFSDL